MFADREELSFHIQKMIQSLTQYSSNTLLKYSNPMLSLLLVTGLGTKLFSITFKRRAINTIIKVTSLNGCRLTE